MRTVYLQSANSGGTAVRRPENQARRGPGRSLPPAAAPPQLGGDRCPREVSPMDAEMRTRLQEARRRAIPLPWRPPFTPLIELGPDRVHKALVAEAGGAQPGPRYKPLDRARLLPL